MPAAGRHPLSAHAHGLTVVQGAAHRPVNEAEQAQDDHARPNPPRQPGELEFTVRLRQWPDRPERQDHLLQWHEDPLRRRSRVLRPRPAGGLADRLARRLTAQSTRLPGRGGSERQGRLPPCSAGVFRITRTTSVRLRSYNSCRDGLTVQWSPDGEHIAWFISPGGNAARLSISDALGRRLQRLVARPILNGVWSPDSTSIAYGYGGDNRRTAVVDVSTGASHAVGKGYPLAWSPDGKELALFRQSPVIPQPPGTIVAVPATGGRARLLFKVPAAPTS